MPGCLGLASAGRGSARAGCLTGTMHVGLDHYADAADSVELNLLVLVPAPVAHLGHVVAPRLVLLVA